ncbi:MAG: transposase [Candidatus Omnitrophota bacterium]|nr:transposase [Candidatus Omnitrophota bacterium]
MPRRARVIINNGCYHVISRGHEKKVTFIANSDYERYFKLLVKYKRKYKFKLYGWCAMPNHPHLVILSDNLSKSMHAVNFSYAQYFNYKYERVGYLWQNRFKSYVVQKDRYLLNLISYIEYNPVRAGIVGNPEDYRWSSYGARVLGYDEFGLLDSLEI